MSDTESERPLSEQIAASREDVRALLEDNRHLSIALLSRLFKDLERETRERFRTFQATRNARLDSLEGDVNKLKERIEVAVVKFRELRAEVDKLAERKPSVRSQ